MSVGLAVGESREFFEEMLELITLQPRPVVAYPEMNLTVAVGLGTELELRRNPTILDRVAD